MPSFEVNVDTTMDVEFEVFCARCGAGLCGQSTGGNSPRRNVPYVQVEPCKNCLKDEFDSGYEKGTEENKIV